MFISRKRGLGFWAVRVAAERDRESEIKENSVMTWAEEGPGLSRASRPV